MRIPSLRWSTRGPKGQPSRWWWRRRGPDWTSIIWSVRQLEQRTSTPAEVEGGQTPTPPPHTLGLRKTYSAVHLTTILTLARVPHSVIPLYLICSLTQQVPAGAGGVTPPPTLIIHFCNIKASALQRCCDKNSLSCKSSWIKTMNESHGFQNTSHSQPAVSGAAGRGGGAKKITYPWSEPLGL